MVLSTHNTELTCNLNKIGLKTQLITPSTDEVTTYNAYEIRRFNALQLKTTFNFHIGAYFFTIVLTLSSYLRLGP